MDQNTKNQKRMMGRIVRLAAAVLATGIVLAASCEKASAADEPKLPLLFEDNFDKGADRWQPTDPAAWKVADAGGDRGKVYSQFKASKYGPPHRSPYNISLVKDVLAGDFVLTAKVKSTCRDYPHRDACLFFGYQDPAHFYYVHLGKKADPNANQIFIVKAAPRTMITDKKSPGTPWDDQWHDVKVVRRTADGTIEVYFDDMKTPAMTAVDKSFLWGQVGLGTFDDTADWDDVKLWGVEAKKP